uniref:NADH-ubiquinone oxidoreductase chain 4L n=1 Tax=Octostigma sinensis TaxID=211997 RepID=U3KTP0_9HEXA|nr:NADH dehydrogenase subunit 4L [Octostigma sinensis]AEV44843.1 NADH dehydrogenase subunit 4L [Octostigma sinensis]
MLFFFVSAIIFFGGLLVVCYKYNYLLMLLLGLEYISLGLFIYVFFYFSFFDLEIYFSVIFLTFVVCEGALGLSILVSLVRMYGNDFLQSISILQC